MASHTTFGTWLKDRRKVLDLTQAAVAERVGCASQTIRHIEAGRLRPSREIAERLATSLEIPEEARTDFIHAARTLVPAHSSSEPLVSSLSPAAPGPPPWKTLPALSPPLFGRHQEWIQLKATWEAVADNRLRLVVLSGEAGTGKTRLADAMLHWVAQQGLITACSRCYADEERLAYEPVTTWLQTPIMRADLAALSTIFLTEVARLLPELLVEYQALPAPALITEPWQQPRFFEALARAIIGNRRPRLLLIDDLQWCDTQTLAWLHYLLRFDPAAPVMVLATLRDDELERNDSLTKLLLAIKQSGQLTEIALGRLGADETEKLAVHVAGQPIPTKLAEQLHRETEGNPLFVIEAIRAITDGYAGSYQETGQDRPAAGTRANTPKIQALVQAQLARLTPQAHELASIAATIGRSFNFAVLAAASGLAESELVQTLEELLQRRIVREQGADAYEFSHNRLREVAYSELSLARRRLLHRQVAQAFEATFTNHADANDEHAAVPSSPGVGAPVSFYLQLAYHWREAGDRGRTIAYLAKAGEQAGHRFASEEAVRLLSEALTLEAELDVRYDQGERGYWEWQLGEAHYALGNMAECSRHLERALAVWGFGRPKSRHRLVLGIAGQLVRHSANRAVPVRLRRSGANDKTYLLAASCAFERLARMAFVASDLPASIYAAIQSVNLGERAGRSPQLAQAYAMMCAATGCAGLHHLAQVYRRLASNAAKDAGQPSAITAVALYDLGTGDWTGARYILKRASETCWSVGDRRGWDESSLMLAHLAHYQGELAASEELAAKVATSAAQRSDDQMQGYALVSQSMNLVCRGRYEEAIPLLETAATYLAGDLHQRTAAVGLMAQAHLRLGNTAAAYKTARTAAEMIAQSRICAVLSLPAYAGVAEVALALWEAAIIDHADDGGQAAAFATQACSALQRFARTWPIGRSQAWLRQGQQAWLAGESAKADAAWHQSLAEAERLAMVYDLGLAHLQRGLHSHDQAQRRHLAHACEIFARLDAVNQRANAEHGV